MFLADCVFYNGTIYTMEEEGSTVSAIAVFDGKIIAVGSTEELKKFPARQYIDLGGKTAIPGFADTHMHLYQDCMDRLKVNLNTSHCVEEVLTKLKENLPNISQKNWLLGENLHADYLKEDRLPSKEELDRVSTAIPIMIGSFCRHTHVLNSKALEICNIMEHRSEIQKDMLGYDKFGNLNGAVKENAYDTYVLPHIPVCTLEENIERMDHYLQYAASLGVTQLHAYQQDNPDGIQLYQELRKRKGLKCRIAFHFPLDPKSERNISTGMGDEFLKVGAAKYLIDGSIGASSALLYNDYSDLPGQRGIMTYSQEELNTLVKEAYDRGNDVAVHAIGDKGNDMVLTAFEHAYRSEIGWDRRFYIIHATLVSPSFIERAKKLPIVICTQPIFIRNFVNLSYRRIGAERHQRFLALKSMMHAGLIVSSGSDAPVRELNPFYGIECAVTRRDIGSDEIITPGEELTVYEALSTYTKYAAYCVHEENLKGTISVGKTADLAVLDKDPFFCLPDELHTIRVEKTILGGKIVFSRS